MPGPIPEANQRAATSLALTCGASDRQAAAFGQVCRGLPDEIDGEHLYRIFLAGWEAGRASAWDTITGEG